jgi:hypothetical protein
MSASDVVHASSRANENWLLAGSTVPLMTRGMSHSRSAPSTSMKVSPESPW